MRDLNRLDLWGGGLIAPPLSNTIAPACILKYYKFSQIILRHFQCPAGASTIT